MNQLPSDDARPDSGATRPISLRRAAFVIVAGVFLGAAFVPIDGVLSDAIRSIRPGGDIRRELETLQQFGSASTIALVSLLIWRLDPTRLVRVLDWLAASAATWGAVFALKCLVGRPRPKHRDPTGFEWPWGSRVVHEGDPARHAWQFWARDAEELWSMPSSHTAFAVVAAVFLSATYPRLKPLVWTMVGVVAFGRVIFGAHYPSDLVVGGSLAWVISTAAVHGAWGRRLFRVPNAQ